MNLEVLLLIVLGKCLLSCSQLLILELSREEAIVPRAGPTGVRSGVILQELCLSQVPHEGAGLAAPDLAGRDQSTSRYDGVGLDHAATLQSSALLNDGSGADNAIVIDDARVQVAIGLDADVLADVDRGGLVVGHRVVSSQHAAIANRGEGANADSIKLSANGHSVPDGGEVRDEHLADQGGVGSNPGLVDLGHEIVERQRLPVSWQINLVSNIAAHARAVAVHGEASFFEHAASVVVYAVDALVEQGADV